MNKLKKKKLKSINKGIINDLTGSFPSFSVYQHFAIWTADHFDIFAQKALMKGRELWRTHEK